MINLQTVLKLFSMTPYIAALRIQPEHYHRTILEQNESGRCLPLK